MRRLLACILMVAMLLSGTALAETTINPNEDRGIKVGVAEGNPSVDGISPTTGRALSSLEIPVGANGLAVSGRYLPMMVQISNPLNSSGSKKHPATNSAGGGTKAPWGVQYADIMYEQQLHSNGETRLTALFSDVIPEAVGPIRSARLGHIWLREEWNGGFMYYGQQTYTQTNVIEWLNMLGATYKGVCFPGAVGEAKPWMNYYEQYKSKYLNSNLKNPDHVSGNAAEISKMVPPDVTPINHTMLFTTEPFTGGDSGMSVKVNWQSSVKSGFNDTFIYNTEIGKYERYVSSTSSTSKKPKTTLWKELETQEALTFDNVIIQWTPTVFKGKDAPVVINAKVDIYGESYPGEGNADIFMNGRHIAGYWKRGGYTKGTEASFKVKYSGKTYTQSWLQENMASRTVFYDENGEEIQFQVGKTFIVQCPLEKPVTYE